MHAVLMVVTRFYPGERMQRPATCGAAHGSARQDRGSSSGWRSSTPADGAGGRRSRMCGRGEGGGEAAGEDEAAKEVGAFRV